MIWSIQKILYAEAALSNRHHWWQGIPSANWGFHVIKSDVGVEFTGRRI